MGSGGDSLLTRRRFIKLSGAGFAGLMAFGSCSLDSSDTDDRIHLLCLSDLHSSHSSMPRLLRAVRQFVESSPVPVAILINGDVFERGNIVALRSEAAIEWKLLEKLQELAPVVLNVGNHEGALEDDLAAVVNRMRNMNMVVLSNIREKSSGNLLADPFHTLHLGGHAVRFAGIATDNAVTYRQVHRNRWNFPDAGDYAAQELSGGLINGSLNVVMNHAGVKSDLDVLNRVPAGSLILGGHDHLRFISMNEKALALHTGWWGALVDVVTVSFENEQHSFSVDTYELTPSFGQDNELRTFVEQQENAHLTGFEKEVIANTSVARSHVTTMVDCVNILQNAAGSEATLINNTTFGAALPRGDVRRHDLNATIRFDGPLMRALVPGSQLMIMKQRANQFEVEDWTQRTGEYVVGRFPEVINESTSYVVCVNGWVSLDFNQEQFLGVSGIDFQPHPSIESIRETIAEGLD